MSGSGIEEYADDAARRQAITRKALWKLDLHVLPPLAVLWLANFIDRSNIGNAGPAGLNATLHLHGNQFNSALAVFYAAYIISEIPSNLILKRIGPNRWLPFIVIAWGTVTTFSGFTKSYGGLVGVRLVLGLCEGGLLPGMVLYLSTLYTRHELQLRIGIFYASASLSGAFGGLLAAAILKMNGVSGQAGWRWIFFLEGMATVVFGALATLFLPQSLETASFLTDEERHFALARFYGDGASSQPPTVHVQETEKSQMHDGEKPEEQWSEDVRPASDTTGPRGGNATMQTEEFEWREVIRGVLDIQTWLTGFAYMGILTSLYSFSLFLPTILKNLGWTGTKTQLMSVPPYIPAAILTVIVAFLSDRYKMRMGFALVLLVPSIIGYIVALTAHTNAVRYGAVFLIAAGVYPAVPCILTILPNNHRGHYKRATSTALQLAIANCAGFVATFAYTSDQAATYYHKGHSIVLSFLCFAFTCLALNLAYCTWENKARVEGRREGNVTKYELLKSSGKTNAPIGDRDPTFLFTY